MFKEPNILYCFAGLFLIHDSYQTSFHTCLLLRAVKQVSIDDFGGVGSIGQAGVPFRGLDLILLTWGTPVPFRSCRSLIIISSFRIGTRRRT